MKIFRSIVPLVLGLAAASCSQGPTAPSDTGSTSTTNPPVTEVYRSTLPVGGSRFYSWSAARTGSVTATLTDIGGGAVPPTVIVNLGIGTPSGTTCLATSSQVQATGDAGLAAQVTATQQAGVSCVIVTDIGNLSNPASFTVTIEHP